MWLVYLSIAVQIFFGIHAVRTGRPFVWVLVIILTSLFGCLAYVIIELAPEWLNSRQGRQLKKAVGQKIDPEKDLKAAQKAFEMADTARNREILAEQYLLLGRFQDAKQVYEQGLKGIYSHDPQLLMGLAKAEFGLNRPVETIAVLERLKTNNPDHKSTEVDFLQARALEGAGRVDEAVTAYEDIHKSYPTPEPACRLAQLYQSLGKKDLAEETYQAVVKRSLTAGKLYNESHKDWIKLAKRETGSDRAA